MWSAGAVWGGVKRWRCGALGAWIVARGQAARGAGLCSVERLWSLPLINVPLQGRRFLERPQRAIKNEIPTYGLDCDLQSLDCDLRS